MERSMSSEAEPHESSVLQSKTHNNTDLMVALKTLGAGNNPYMDLDNSTKRILNESGISTQK